MTIQGGDMKLFLDTNVWLRFFIADNEEFFLQVKRLIELAEEGRVRLSASTFVLSEFVYVESSFYKIDKKNIVEDLESISSIKNIRIIESTDFYRALEIFKKSSEKKWSDCIIISSVPENYFLCSFDLKLKNLIGKKRFVTPQEAIERIEKL